MATSDPTDLMNNSGALGGAAGSQGQFAIYLQLFKRLVIAAEASLGTNPYAVYAFTSTGDVTIATAFPQAKAGIISIRKGTPAATNVTLPATGGPWSVVDGAGVAAAHNITVLPTSGSGQTIIGASSNLISSNWGFVTYVLDGSNWLVSL